MKAALYDLRFACRITAAAIADLARLLGRRTR